MPQRRDGSSRSPYAPGVTLLVTALGGCTNAAPTPASPPTVELGRTPTPLASGDGERARPCAKKTPNPWRGEPVAGVDVTPDDPLAGKFSLDAATADLPSGGGLSATIRTDRGDLSCELWDDLAPITVANFVGLARGLRPYKDRFGTWVKKPAYDGTTFHRIIKGFMIQGGDPKGDGSGEPGYVIPDEIWEGARHDRRGMLCMANRGRNTNGMQFFVVDAPAAHLDGQYTIFGMCQPEAVLDELTALPTAASSGRPDDPPRIRQVVISRTPCR